MSEFMREALPIIVMYGFVLLLAPFIAFAMWMAFDGDRLRTDAELEVEQAAPTQATVAVAAPAPTLTVEAATTAA